MSEVNELDDKLFEAHLVLDSILDCLDEADEYRCDDMYSGKCGNWNRIQRCIKEIKTLKEGRYGYSRD